MAVHPALPLRRRVLLWLTAAAVAGGTAGSGGTVAAAQPADDPLVETRSGDLPLILSAPHGGRLPIPGAPPRTDTGARTFTVVRDLRTDRLAWALAERLAETTGRRPWVVVARFSRRYADANRPLVAGTDSPAGATAHRAYHRALADACAEILGRWGHGLLLDLHAQKVDRTAVIRGTGHGTTVARLLARAGPAALAGPHSLTRLLAEQDFGTIPAAGEPPAAERVFTGGHIVRRHGGARGCGVDAIQLEFGGALLQTAQLADTADRAARAIAAFLDRYYAVR